MHHFSRFWSYVCWVAVWASLARPALPRMPPTCTCVRLIWAERDPSPLRGQPGLHHIHMEGSQEQGGPVPKDKQFSRFFFHMCYYCPIAQSQVKFKGCKNRFSSLMGGSTKYCHHFFFLFPQLLGVLQAEDPQLSAFSRNCSFSPKESHLSQGHSHFFPVAARSGNWSIQRHNSVDSCLTMR